MSGIVVIGTGGLGRETLWALQRTESGKREILGFLTNERSQHGSVICGAPVLGAESWIVGRGDVAAICCIGDPRNRRRVVHELEQQGVSFALAIHPSVEMSEHVVLGAGCIVGARAVLTTQVSIGEHVVIGAGAIVSHDCRLENFATLAPGVVLAGHVTIGYGAELGVGACVIPGKTVGRGAQVGAQSAVVRDIDENTVVAGVPAGPIRAFPRDQWL